MLSAVLDVLRERQWFNFSQPFEHTINFTRGACAWLLLTRQGVPATYVKFSEHISLHAEAQRYEAASHQHPHLVPRFVGWARQGAMEVMVCEAVDYVGLNAVKMRSAATQQHVLTQLLPVFSGSATWALPDELAQLSNASLAAAMQPYFDATAQAALARRWLGSEALAWLASLPSIPQHGDLVLNNLGLRADRSLIVFDWEDLGAMCLPGLDLFTLELSLAGGVQGLLAGRRDTGSVVQGFVRQACGAMGLPLPEYLAMTPVYALAFRYLKRNYGPGVRDRMDDLLAALARESAGA